jgi:hypothetical protein
MLDSFFQAFRDTGFNLGVQGIMPGIDGCADKRRKSGIDQARWLGMVTIELR